MARHQQTLARIPLLHRLDEEEICRFDRNCSWRRVEAGVALVNYDEEGSDIFFVICGHLRALIRNRQRRVVTLRDIKDGEYFGDLTFIDHKTHATAVMAVTDSTVALMPASAMHDLLDRHPEIKDKLLEKLVAQVRGLVIRVNESAILDVRHRIYSELLRLSHPDPSDEARSLISPPPTQSDLAALVGTRRETISREISVLARAGLVERRRGALVLLNASGLKHMIEEARGDS